MDLKERFRSLRTACIDWYFQDIRDYKTRATDDIKLKVAIEELLALPDYDSLITSK